MHITSLKFRHKSISNKDFETVQETQQKTKMGMKRCRESEGEIKSMSNLAKCLIMLSRGGETTVMTSQSTTGRVFECKTCTRQFPSFQALGGHRASHKKPRLMGELDHENKNDILTLKPKTHECSICGVEFAIGQALGGHMRRHRNTISEDLKPRSLSIQATVVPKSSTRSFLGLDLNLTPLENDLKLHIGSLLSGKISSPLVPYVQKSLLY